MFEYVQNPYLVFLMIAAQAFGLFCYTLSFNERNKIRDSVNIMKAWYKYMTTTEPMTLSKIKWSKTSRFHPHYEVCLIKHNQKKVDLIAVLFIAFMFQDAFYVTHASFVLLALFLFTTIVSFAFLMGSFFDEHEEPFEYDQNEPNKYPSVEQCFEIYKAHNKQTRPTIKA